MEWTWMKQTIIDVIDTGNLFASLKVLPLRADDNYFEVGLSQPFLEYGLWQDYGTGRETPRGNSSDLGRVKSSRASRTQSQTGLNSAETQPRTAFRKRQRRRWFSRQYYASVMNLKEFLEENIGATFTGLISDFARRCNNRH